MQAMTKLHNDVDRGSHKHPRVMARNRNGAEPSSSTRIHGEAARERNYAAEIRPFDVTPES